MALLSAKTRRRARKWFRRLVAYVGGVAWRYRAGLAPLWGAGGIAAAGWGLAFRPDLGTVPLAAATVTAAVVWFTGERLSPRLQAAWMWLVPVALDDGRRGVLDRPTERGYLAVLLLAAGGWLSCRARYGWDDTQAALLLGVAALGAPWWWHRGWRRKRPMNTWARRWRVVDDNEDLKVWHRSKVIEATGNSTVTTLRVRLRRGLTVKHVARDALVLDSAMGLRGGAITVTSHPHAASDVVVRIVPRDPWTQPIPHPMPALRSLTRESVPRVMVGRYEDATEDLLRISQHMIVVGASGSGKSEWLQSLVAWILGYEHTVIVAADLASGATFDVWEDVLACPLATDVPSAYQMLTNLFAFIEHRERKLTARRRAGERINVLPVSADEPEVFVIIDEFPDLVNGARMTTDADGAALPVMTVLERIAKKARKVRVWLILAAQNPGVADVGSTTLRAQFPVTVGLGLDEQQSKTLWGSLRSQGWDSEPLAVGSYLLRDRNDKDHSTPRVAKGVFLDPDARAEVIAAAAARPPRLIGHEARLLGGRLGGHAIGDTARYGTFEEVDPEVEAGRPPLTLVQGGAGRDEEPAEVPPPAPEAPRPAPRTREAVAAELDALVLAELPPAHQGGVRPGEIAGQVGVSRHKVQRSLARLEAAGRAARNGDGTWSVGTP